MKTGASTGMLSSTTASKPPSGFGLPPVMAWRIASSAPKRSAWRPARRASSAPPMPSGKPKKFSIRDV